MNRKLTLAAIVLSFASLTACNAVEVATYTDHVVGVDVRPVESSLLDSGDAVTTCEGGYVQDGAGIVTEGGTPIPCTNPDPAPLANFCLPGEIEGGQVCP